MNLIQNQQKMLDILFAKKNKAYGAYAIRSAYGETLFKSIGIVCLTLALTFGSILYFQDHKITDHPTGQVFDKDSLYIVTVYTPENKPDHPETTSSASEKRPESSVKTSAFSLTQIVDQLTDTAEHREITGVVTSTTGVTANNGGTENGGGQSGTDNGNNIVSNPLELFAVDENPEFEGGLNALLGFVRKHVKYPAMAVENQKQGTLHVKFVVDEVGNISQIEVMNHIGYGLDDEAKRVVSLIPKFKSPGKVKGKPVKTYYQLPIKFKLG